MTTRTPARRRAQANVRVGVGTRFAYDGETVTIRWVLVNVATLTDRLTLTGRRIGRPDNGL
jgi:hypothetical protein